MMTSNKAKQVKNGHILKIVLIGDGGVGKSSLITRYVKDEFRMNCLHTIGVEFMKKELCLNEVNYTLQIWDTAGQELFRSLRTPFYRGTDACFLTFAVDDEKSFQNLKMWKDEFIKYANLENEPTERFPFIVLGNKVDLLPPERKICYEEAKKFSDANEMEYFETSAKNSANVEAAFIRTVELIREMDHDGNLIGSSSKENVINLSNPNQVVQERACC